MKYCIFQVLIHQYRPMGMFQQKYFKHGTSNRVTVVYVKKDFLMVAMHPFEESRNLCKTVSQSYFIYDINVTVVSHFLSYSLSLFKPHTHTNTLSANLSNAAAASVALLSTNLTSHGSSKKFHCCRIANNLNVWVLRAYLE